MKPGGGSGRSGQVGRLQQPLEQRKHGTGSKRAVDRIATPMRGAVKRCDPSVPIYRIGGERVESFVSAL